jgi:transcriptional regulator of acetoin/glycerol metabolism
MMNSPAPEVCTNIRDYLQANPMSLEALERCAVEAAMKKTQGNVTRAADLLGVGRTTFYRKLKQYELSPR